MKTLKQHIKEATVGKPSGPSTIHQDTVEDGVISAEDAQRLGVFWHTQGSGKSYSMVFLTQKILRVFGGGYTFLLITDRKELDKQIYGTFAGVGAVKDKKARATDGENLKELLKKVKT